MWKFLKRKLTKKHYRPRIEEDPNAHVQNREELEFNKTNPIYEHRIEKAKRNAISRMSEDTKAELLYKIHINQSMEEQFHYIDKRDEK